MIRSKRKGGRRDRDVNNKAYWQGIASEHRPSKSYWQDIADEVADSPSIDPPDDLLGNLLGNLHAVTDPYTAVVQAHHAVNPTERPGPVLPAGAVRSGDDIYPNGNRCTVCKAVTTITVCVNCTTQAAKFP